MTLATFYPPNDPFNDPITAEMGLSGMDLEAWYDVTEYVPEGIQEKRITWMEAFSMPLTLSAMAYLAKAPVGPSAVVVAASYMAPYPAALLAAFMAWKEVRDHGRVTAPATMVTREKRQATLRRDTRPTGRRYRYAA